MKKKTSFDSYCRRSGTESSSVRMADSRCDKNMIKKHSRTCCYQCQIVLEVHAKGRTLFARMSTKNENTTIRKEAII